MKRRLPSSLHRLLLILDVAFLRGALKAMVSKRDALTTFRVLGRPFVVRPPSFLAQYRSIFLERGYAFDAGRPDPAILDLGANVGMSCAFFKHLYPAARITAFEADPELAEVLRGNLASLGHEDIEIVAKAAWVENTTLHFAANGLGGGRVAANAPGGVGSGGTSAGSIEVPAIDIAAWLENQRLANRSFDLIKMDIEGAERTLLPHAIEAFARAPRLVFEYHSEPGDAQDLGLILSSLERHGYRYHVQSEGVVLAPFVESLRGRFDNRLVIYATRDADEP